MPSRARSSRESASLSVLDYYEDADVRHAMLEYAGATAGSPATAVYFAGLCPGDQALPAWDRDGVRVAPDELGLLCDRGCDIARSLWDRAHLLFLIELDYENVDEPAEPYLRPVETFFKLEPVYLAARRVFAELGLGTHVAISGRGYHFVGQINLDDPLVAALAALLPDTPAWHASLVERRQLASEPPMPAVQARAAGGLGLLLEYAAHLILNAAADSARVPVVVNGTVVGTGRVGRECVSVDFSHAGDPLDVRHVRSAFSAYQWHLLRPDIFGRLGQRHLEPLAAVPRPHRPLHTIVISGRDLRTAVAAARRTSVALPDISGGLSRLLEAYRESPLAAFHRSFYTEQGPAPRSLDLDELPPCVQAPLLHPNDLLLKPEHLQHLVRSLMARDWTPAEIAALVRSKYEEPHEWGNRWARMHPQTRAEFDVRVFAGMIHTELDTLVDFNCVSAQEKDLCPRMGCTYDLRHDRDRLSGRRQS